jgi:trk system potassium uptake protein TrkH
MIGPILMATVLGEMQIAIRLSIYLLLGLFLSLIIFKGLEGRKTTPPHIGSFILAIFIWTGLPLLISLPLGDITGLSRLDALFDSVAAFTTTGASTIHSWENVSPSIIFFYAQIQWMGGLVTLLTLVLLVAPSSIGGLPTPRSVHFFGRSVLSNDAASFKLFIQVLKLYGGATLFCFVLLLLNSTEPFYALILSLLALSTGHIDLPGAVLSDALGNSGMFILGVFLLVGGTNIFWHESIIKFRKTELINHRESYFVIVLSAVLGLVFALILYRAAGSSAVLPSVSALSEGFFHAVSLVTTSGLETREGVIALLPPSLILFIIFIGCGVFSTGGGIKIYRVGAMLMQAGAEVKRLLYPHLIEPKHVGAMRYDLETMKAILSFFIATILVIGIGVMGVALSEISGEASLFAAISAFANAGAFYGAVLVDGQAEKWPLYHELTWYAKMILASLMIFGRLEVLVILGALNLTFWRNR